MVALIEVNITSLMKSPLIEVIVTSPINEQMVGAIDSDSLFIILSNLINLEYNVSCILSLYPEGEIQIQFNVAHSIHIFQ